MSVLNELSTLLEGQFGDPVPDSRAMRRYAHKRYVDVNKDWIPKKQMAAEGLYVRRNKVKVRYGTEKFGDPIELLMGKDKNKTPYMKTVGGHKVYASYVVSLSQESGDISDAKEILFALKGKTRHKNLSISPADLDTFIKRTAVHLWATVPGIQSTDLVVTIGSSSDFAKKLAKELALKSSDKTLVFSPDSIVKSKVEDIRVNEAPNSAMKGMLEHIMELAKSKGEFQMKKVPGKMRKFIYDFLRIDPVMVSKIEGRNVLLVDDYLISGSTISESFRLIDFLAPASLMGVTYFKLQ